MISFFFEMDELTMKSSANALLALTLDAYKFGLKKWNSSSFSGNFGWKVVLSPRFYTNAPTYLLSFDH